MKRIFLAIACVALSTFIQGQTLVTADFTAATFPPTGWTIDAQSGNWSRVTTNIAAGTTGGEAMLNWTPSFTATTRLISPLIDLTGKPTVTLSFKHMLDYYDLTTTIGVATRTGTGGAWTTVWSQAVTADIPATTKDVLINNANTNLANFQFCIYFNGLSDNIDYWYIDDINLSVPYAIDGAMSTITVPNYVIQGNTSITGAVKNAGTTNMTSFNVNYKVDGGTTNTTAVTGQNLANGATYNYTCTQLWNAIPGNHTLKVWIDNVNGTTDLNHANDTLTKTIVVATNSTTMMPLFEEFTSSTCAPCASFNSTTFTPWLTSHVGTQSLIKYQMNWPSPGDIYYTAEGGTRRAYYGVNAVPQLFVQGIDCATSTAGLNAAFASAIATPAFFTIASTPTYTGTNVYFPVIINPYITGAFKVHAVIVEKTTTGNVGNNGETSFKNVMMKMVPSASGTTVNFTAGTGYFTTFTQDMSATNYEEMSDLQLILFIQNDANKNSMQSIFKDIVLVSAVPAQPSTVTGAASPCQTSTQTYSVTNIANVVYTWTVPAGWTIVSGQGTNSISVTVGSGSGNVSVTPSNAFGNGTVRTFAVTPGLVPAQPSAISGATAPCQTSSQTYSVTSVGGVTYNWTFPAGWSQTGGGTTNSVTVTVGGTAGTITCTPSNTCGSGTAQTLAVTMGPVPAQPSVITGSTSPCLASSQNYSVIITAGVTYTWLFPSGWSQTGGGTTNSVTATVGSGTGNITVTPSNLCGTGTAQTLAVSITPAPSITTPPSNSTVGVGSNTSFAVAASGSGLTYQWQLSTDGGGSWNNITAAGTNPVYSNWTTATLGVSGVVIGNNGYQYRCIVSGTCSPTATSAAALLTVNNTAAVTGQPSNAVVCSGVDTSFSVVATGGALTYQWQLSTNGGGTWNNITAAGTNPTYSGWTAATLHLTGIAVSCDGYQYRCNVDNGTPPVATTNAATLTVNTVPAQPSLISGNQTPCEALTETYTVTNVAGVTYTWAFPMGWTQTGGGTTNSVTVTTTSSSGTIIVTPSNGCGNGGPQSLTITSGAAATANAGSDQVLSTYTPATLAGTIGGGATSATWSGGLGSFSPNANTLNATYTPGGGESLVTLVLTTDDPAGSCIAKTDTMTITYTVGIENNRNNALMIFPNPVTNILTVVVPENNGQLLFTIFDATGREMILQSATVPSGPYTYTINVSHLASGMYTMRVSSNDNYYMQKFFKLD
ncbi:MAG: T9SS type A sorting domain-containing protein [Bacteroidota bacterium]